VLLWSKQPELPGAANVLRVKLHWLLLHLSRLPEASDGRPSYCVINADESEKGTCTYRSCTPAEFHAAAAAVTGD
jgi:hypothetical protein